MRSLRTAILWITGILLWVFGLSIGLAWLNFGYLDLKTVATMGGMFIPLLGVAIGILIWTRVHDPIDEQDREESKDLNLPQSHGKASAIRAPIRPPVEDLKQAGGTSPASRKMEPVKKGEAQ